MKRPDDPKGVMAHAKRFDGGAALVVLGGASGARWEQVRDAVRPDVILTANGATRLPGAEYWLLTENMNFCFNRAQAGDQQYAGYLRMLDPGNTAPVKMLSHRSWNLLTAMGIDPQGYVCVRRKGYALEEMPADFTFRTYGEGFLSGGISLHTEAWQPSVKVRVGTVGLHLLHLASILGVRDVHTIGFDLVGRGHWYPHPDYKEDRFRTEKMFLEHRGVQTQLYWLETAAFLRCIEPILERDGVRWVDHSEGLLKVEGLRCASIS